MTPDHLRLGSDVLVLSLAVRIWRVAPFNLAESNSYHSYMGTETIPLHWPEPHARACPVLKLLHGQTALVTGASSGIGRALAIALGHAGANVVINYLGSPEKAEEVAKEI